MIIKKNNLPFHWCFTGPDKVTLSIYSWLLSLGKYHFQGKLYLRKVSRWWMLKVVGQAVSILIFEYHSTCMSTHSLCKLVPRISPAVVILPLLTSKFSLCRAQMLSYLEILKVESSFC